MVLDLGAHTRTHNMTKTWDKNFKKCRTRNVWDNEIYICVCVCVCIAICMKNSFHYKNKLQHNTNLKDERFIGFNPQLSP